MSDYASGHVLFGFELPDFEQSFRKENGCRTLALGNSHHGERKNFVAAVHFEVLPGDQHSFDPVKLAELQADATARLKQVCETHGIEFQEPRWYLGCAFD